MTGARSPCGQLWAEGNPERVSFSEMARPPLPASAQAHGRHPEDAQCPLAGFYQKQQSETPFPLDLRIPPLRLLACADIN